MKTEQPAPAATTFNTVKEVEANLKARMDKAVSDLQHDMATIRTGRASLGILDHIRVDYYGTPTPLNQIANLHVPEPSLITVQPWDVSQIGPIERAIRVSDLGLNPANDGKIIRLPIPPLNEERGKEQVGSLHASPPAPPPPPNGSPGRNEDTPPPPPPAPPRPRSPKSPPFLAPLLVEGRDRQ